ncbi:MAG TPA: di-heme oxidoredictase family protein [Planctomycetota bacterium]|nr:di-heme oxidoredictase family protein [Planctomycetota bacterium]
MGRRLADPQPTPVTDARGERLVLAGVTQTAAPDEFLTPELWGAGNTGPWLHDGRAATLAEAILLHGEDAPPATVALGRSEAQEARDAFKALPSSDRLAVIAFLQSLITIDPAVIPAAPGAPAPPRDDDDAR